MSTALPSRCGVVGGGRMGSGIAHALLVAGSEVTLVESGADMAEDYWQSALDKIRAERIRANKVALQKRLRAAAMKREREVAAIKSLMRHR